MFICGGGILKCDDEVREFKLVMRPYEMELPSAKYNELF